MLMENTNIVNIVNFIRAVEPRFREEPDLFEPVRREMELAKQHALPATWLLQYDALVKGPYVDFLKREMPESHEAGCWFEVVEELAEAAGIRWRGRWSWDWNVEVGFSIGYTPRERERLADAYVARFAELFGRPPASVGSWCFDAHLFNYLHEKYGIAAGCNCKDQYGTDGYTLWGGYWANAYYPSRKNAYLPAQSEAMQIPVPVFRMLGSDPLYQYSAGVAGNGQPVITLEPVYEGIGGGSREWVDWFLRENFGDGPHFALSYAQAGQENSFGWERIGRGLPYQFRELARLRDAGKIRVETLEASGRWFRGRYPVTPVSAVVTLDDWKKENRAGIWYLSRFGRVNLFRDADRGLVIRDWQLFRESYAEPFLEQACPSNVCCYDALPLVDGNLWNPSAIRFPGGPGIFESVEDAGNERMRIVWKSDAGGRTVILLGPESVEIEFPAEGEALLFDCNVRGAEYHRTAIFHRDGALRYRHCGEDYGFRAEKGSIVRDGGREFAFRLAADGRKLVLATE